MEIILKQDIENLGFKYDLISVKNGYGRNYLIPNGFAVLATISEKKQLTEILKQKAYKEAKIVEAAKEIEAKLKTFELKIPVKVGKSDKMFGSINSLDLSKSLSKEGMEVDKKYIKIAGGVIKKLGKYSSKIRLHRDVIANFDFEIVAAK